MLQETEVKAAEDLTAALNNFNGLTQEVVEANKAALKEELDDLVSQGFDDAMGKVQSLIDKGKTEIQETATSGKQTITEDTANAQKVISTGKNEIQELITQGQEAITNDKQDGLDELNAVISQAKQDITNQKNTSIENITGQEQQSIDNISAKENASKSNIIAQENASVQAVTDTKDVSVATLMTTTQGHIDNLQNKYDGLQKRLSYTVDSLLEKDSPDGNSKITNTNNGISIVENADAIATVSDIKMMKQDGITPINNDSQILNINSIKQHLSLSKETTAGEHLQLINLNDDFIKGQFERGEYVHDNMDSNSDNNLSSVPNRWKPLVKETKNFWFKGLKASNVYSYSTRYMLWITNKNTGKTVERLLWFYNNTSGRMCLLEPSNALKKSNPEKYDEIICVYLTLANKLYVFKGTILIDEHELTATEIGNVSVVENSDRDGCFYMHSLCADTKPFFTCTFKNNVGNENTNIMFNLNEDTLKIESAKVTKDVFPAAKNSGYILCSNGNIIYTAGGIAGTLNTISCWSPDYTKIAIQPNDADNNKILTKTGFYEHSVNNNLEKPVFICGDDEGKTYIVELEGFNARAHKFDREDLNTGTYYPVFAPGCIETDNSLFYFVGNPNVYDAGSGVIGGGATTGNFYFKIDKKTFDITQLTYPWNAGKYLEMVGLLSSCRIYGDKILVFSNERWTTFIADRSKYIIIDAKTDNIETGDYSEIGNLVPLSYEVSGSTNYRIDCINFTFAVNKEGLGMAYHFNMKSGQSKPKTITLILFAGDEITSYDIPYAPTESIIGDFTPVHGGRLQAYGRNFRLCLGGRNAMVIVPKPKLLDGAPSLAKPTILFEDRWDESFGTKTQMANRPYSWENYKEKFSLYGSQDTIINLLLKKAMHRMVSVSTSLRGMVLGYNNYRVGSDSSSKICLKWDDKIIAEICD